MKKLLSFSIIVVISAVLSIGILKITGILNPKITYTFENGVLTISGKGKMPDYAHCNECAGLFEQYRPWDDESGKVKEIIIEEGITRIGDNAFYGIYDVEKITLPKSLESIGRAKLESKITSFYIPEKVNDVNARSFWGIALEEVVVDPDNKNFCSVDGVLFNKSMTKLIYYPQCKKGKEYTIPKSVTTIGEHAFQDTDLVKINVHGGVNKIGKLAFHCYDTKEINYGGTIEQWKSYGDIIDYDFDSFTVNCSNGKIENNPQ